MVRDGVHIYEQPPTVKSAARLLDLLEMLTVARVPIGVSEIARQLDIPKSSAHMLLLTLEGRGYVVSDEQRRFALSAILGRRGREWVGGELGALLDIAKPVMNKLAHVTGESVFLGRRRDETIARVRAQGRQYPRDSMRWRAERTALVAFDFGRPSAFGIPGLRVGREVLRRRPSRQPDGTNAPGQEEAARIDRWSAKAGLLGHARHECGRSIGHCRPDCWPQRLYRGTQLGGTDIALRPHSEEAHRLAYPVGGADQRRNEGPLGKV